MHIGIDTWALVLWCCSTNRVSVGLPVAYRDSRSNGLMAQAQQQLGKRDIYQRERHRVSSFCKAPFINLRDGKQPETYSTHIAHALLMPDYFSYRLTGKMNWQ